MPLSSVLGAQSLVRPGVCTSTTRPASPFEGQLIYETDTDRVVSYNGSSWSYLTGTRFIEWTSFTPTWSNLTVGNATQSFSYSEHGNLMLVEGVITLGSTSSVSSNPSFTIPNGRTSNGTVVGQNLRLEDTGSTNFFGQLYVSTTAIDLYTFNVGSTYATLASISSTVPFAWGTGDKIHVGCAFRII